MSRCLLAALLVWSCAPLPQAGGSASGILDSATPLSDENGSVPETDGGKDGGANSTGPQQSDGASPPVEGGAPAFRVEMPIRREDVAHVFLSLWPYGVRGGGHTYDGGHPGWDIEYKFGSFIRAPATGTVQSVHAVPDQPDARVIQIDHLSGTHGYRTVFTNIEKVLVNVGDLVEVGVPIGSPKAAAAYVNGPVTYYMTHFQVDDMAHSPKYADMSNPMSVSPESYLSDEGKILFREIWSNTAYPQELTSPFASISRGPLNPYPLRRTWTLQGAAAGLPASLEITDVDPATRAMGASTHDYAMRDSSDAITESGTIELEVNASPSKMTFVSTTGARRTALYDIVDDQMRIAWSSSSTKDLASAAVLTTVR